ncbi:septum formation initiator family protein [Parablautia intestinalis]|jgi:cell division protein DivIC|uniref:Septum formation initiator family protein n=1 Tax=Parablautia intestinalis TaxID=2320100 RepID=A0A3A9AKN4_9FIRM|nr:septum formation initiator family protein [Parablautia intestinalis]MCI8615256.1 septum formation initiator family protein [Lachnospiraceae bacterium]MDE7049078.1 septum formation initiator family protein [Lachnospiraceae bacterium]RKI91947.1 septum formation initiator family protein [Parablautia intestinalis]
MARKAARVAHRKKRQNRFGMFLVSVVVIMLLVVVTFNSVGLMAKRGTYRQKEAALEEQIAAEEERAQEIEEFEKYTHTKKYIEEIARDKLGLVYEGEIVFRDEN